jgi:hypothetical protein
MSKLSDLLAKKAAAPNLAEPGSPAPAPAAKPVSFADKFKQTAAVAKHQAQLDASQALSAGMSNQYVPPPSAPLEDFQNFEVELTADVTTWPDDGSNAYPDKQQAALRQHLAYVGKCLNTDEISDALIRCMQFIHENPAMKDLLLPADVGLLVQALSSSANVVVARKNENKSTATKRKAIAAEVMNDLADLGF